MTYKAVFRNGQDRSLQIVMNNKSGLQGAAPAGAFRRPTAVRRLLGRRWVLSPRRGETLLVMPNAANHLQGPMLATASITGFAGISHFTLRRRAHNVRPYGLFSVKPEIPVVLTLFSSLYTQKTQTRSFCTHAQRGRFLLPLPAAAEHPGISSLCNQ